MQFVAYALAGLMCLALFVWWLARPRPQRVPASDLQRHLDYLVEYCEPGAALMFSSDRRSWPVRVEFSSLSDGTADVRVVVYSQECATERPAEFESSVAAASQDTPEMWRPSMQRVQSVVRLALYLAPHDESSQIYVKGAPVIYGKRTDSRIRDDYQTMPYSVPIGGRIRRYYEAKYADASYELPHLFKISAITENSRAPHFPQYAHPEQAAA